MAAAKVARLLAASGIPPRHQGWSLDRNGSAPWLRAHDRIRDRLGTGTLIALMGTRGSGKTQLAVQAIRASCAAGRSARYTTTMEFFMSVRETFGSPTRSEAGVIDQFARTGLLVLDEIHIRGESPWEDRLLDHLIDRRYREMVDTILISNLSRDELRAAIGPSIVDRINETGMAIECTWPSFRNR